MWKPPEGLCKRKGMNGWVKLKDAMDGCMLLIKFHSQWKLQKEKKASSSIQWCQSSDLSKNWRVHVTSETSDRCLQELNLLCCCQLFTLYACNSLSTECGACGWSTRGSYIWPVLFVQLLPNTWCLSQLSHGGADSRSPKVVHLDWTYRS